MRAYRLVGESDSTREINRLGSLLSSEWTDNYDEFNIKKTWCLFEKSPEFGYMTPRDRSLARYTMKRIVGDEAPWTIQIDEDTDNLLATPSPKFVVPSTAHDAAILSGAAGWLVAKSDSKEIKTGRRNILKLSDYVNIAVASLIFGEKHSNSNLSYFVDGYNVLTQQTVGGNFHGDFQAEQKRFATIGPIFDPTGVERAFAPPIAGDVVNAYHSIECELAINMLCHLAAGDYELLERAKVEILNEISIADTGRSGGPFADFGARRTPGDEIILEDHFRKHETGEVLERYIVYPGNRRRSMEIVSLGNSVVLRNVSLADGEVGSLGKYDNVSEGMSIANDEIPKFIATMAAAAGGRTSLAQIRWVIENAYVLERGKM